MEPLAIGLIAFGSAAVGGIAAAIAIKTNCVEDFFNDLCISDRIKDIDIYAYALSKQNHRDDHNENEQTETKAQKLKQD